MDQNLVHRQEVEKEEEEQRQQKAGKETEDELKRCLQGVKWDTMTKILPIGVKFAPSDTDLVDLLETKIASPEEKFSGITCDFDVYTCHPENLHSMSEGYRHHDGKMYIFSQLKWQNESGKKMERGVAPSGHWKLSGSKSKETDHIENSKGVKVATKASLAFHGKPCCKPSNGDDNNNNNSGNGDASKKELKTKWLMQEYRLISPTVTKIGGGINTEMALCVVYNFDQKGTKKDETGYRRSSSPEEEEVIYGGNGDQSISGCSSVSPPPQNQNLVTNGFSTSHHHHNQQPCFPHHQIQPINGAIPLYQSYPLHEYNQSFYPPPLPPPPPASAFPAPGFNTNYQQNGCGNVTMRFGNNAVVENGGWQQQGSYYEWGEQSNGNGEVSPSGYLSDALLVFNNRKRPAENGV